MKNIHHTEHKSDPFDYDEYKADHFWDGVDWSAVVAIILFAAIAAGALGAL